MCGKKELFSSLDECVQSLVKFGNNSNISFFEKGQIVIKLKDQYQNFISDVLYTPDLHNNLLSTGQLSKKGCNIQIHQGYCTIFDKYESFISGVKITPN